MPSVLTNAPFTKTTLTYTVQGAASGTDANGNPTFATTTGTISAFVSPDKARQLRMEPGADKQLIPVRVELDDPLTLPTGVGLGSVLTLTWAGRASKLRITSVAPNDLVGVDFGTFLLGEITRA